MPCAPSEISSRQSLAELWPNMSRPFPARFLSDSRSDCPASVGRPSAAKGLAAEHMKCAAPPRRTAGSGSVGTALERGETFSRSWDAGPDADRAAGGGLRRSACLACKGLAKSRSALPGSLLFPRTLEKRWQWRLCRGQNSPSVILLSVMPRYCGFILLQCSSWTIRGPDGPDATNFSSRSNHQSWFCCPTIQTLWTWTSSKLDTMCLSLQSTVKSRT